MNEELNVSIPLVITNENDVFHGFTPGIVMTDIMDSNIEVVKTKLQQFVQEKITEMIENKKTMPFFPTNEEIKADFEGVVYIKRIKVN